MLFDTSLIALLAILTREFSHALRDVRVKVPHAVRRGEKATLKCFYDIEDDSLYSVKWYKGRREFYRYTPKETPAMKVFQFPGVRVEKFHSNESQLILDAVTIATSGKYSCEVSADAPSFHTLIAAGELEVVEFPHNAPYISGIRPRYRIGDILRGNCTSRHSKPAANLTWTVNNEEANPSHVRHFKILHEQRNDMETSIVGIHFVVTDLHFEQEKLKLRCSAHIHNIYWKSTEKSIVVFDQQHKFSTSADGGHSVNMVQPEEPPYDQYALHDSDLLRKKDSYLTQLQDLFFRFVPSAGAAGNDISDDNDAAWDTSSGGAQHNALHWLILLLLLFYLPRKQLVELFTNAMRHCCHSAAICVVAVCNQSQIANGQQPYFACAFATAFLAPSPQQQQQLNVAEFRKNLCCTDCCCSFCNTRFARAARQLVPET